MLKETYINELNTFTLSENFKAKTIALLEQKQQECEYRATPAKTITFKPKRRKLLAAVCACAIVVALSVTLVKYYTGNNAILSAETDIFTIEDTEAIEILKSVKPLQAEYDTGGGMGYEGILLKDISQYDNGNPFSIYDTFDTLPVFRFAKPDIDQALNETERLLNSLNADIETAKKEITLTEIIYYEGHVTSHKDVTLDENDFALSKIKFGEPLIPHRYETTFSGGDIQMWIPQGETRISIDIDAELTDQQIMEYIDNHFSAALGFDNSVTCADVDYNIYGEENPTYYIYNHSEDYAQNIFNYSVNNARVHYFTKEESLEESNQVTFWIRTDSYTKGEELPAINYKQALGLLYSGDYYSSVPYEITDESVVSRIELVYKDAPYDEMTLTRSEVSLPFYKFYVELDEMNIEEQGLTDYGIYYVCAINPGYIEITEDYASFN